MGAGQCKGVKYILYGSYLHLDTFFHDANTRSQTATSDTVFPASVLCV